VQRVAAGASQRIVFLDGLRGVAIIFMVVNHTARWWLDLSVGIARYHIIYLTVPLSAPLFLFLVGFCLPLSYLNSTVTHGWSFWQVARRNIRRGAQLVLAGWLLTLLVFPTEPLFGGEVLQTIGLSLVGLTLILPLLSRPLMRPLLLALALGWYVTFNLAHPSLPGWLAGHPVLSVVGFTGFPPWPWFAFPLLGALLGWVWTARRRRGVDDGPFFSVMIAAGIVCIAVFLPLELWLGSAPLHFTSRRDLVLNRHWNPGAVTCLFILGYLFTVIPLGHYLMEVRRYRPGWLVVLGQNALMLYFVHQIIALTLVRERLGVLLSDWLLYVLANVALLLLLIGLGWLWPEIKRRARRLVPRRESALSFL
jgi:uncharacterized membrane protein